MKTYIVIERNGACTWLRLIDVACWFTTAALVITTAVLCIK